MILSPSVAYRPFLLIILSGIYLGTTRSIGHRRVRLPNLRIHIRSEFEGTVEDPFGADTDVVVPDQEDGGIRFRICGASLQDVPESINRFGRDIRNAKPRISGFNPDY